MFDHPASFIRIRCEYIEDVVVRVAMLRNYRQTADACGFQRFEQRLIKLEQPRSFFRHPLAGLKLR